MHEPMNSHLPEPVRRVRRDPRRVLAAGLAASLLVHALVFLAFRFRVDIVPEPVQKPIPLVRVVPAIQVYDIREVPGVSTPIEVQILEQQAMDPLPVPALPEAAPEVAAEPQPSTIDALSVGERLRYRMAAPDVWRAPSEEIERPEMTDEERARARVAAQLGAFNDSVAAAAALAEKSMDWTVKDGEGGRWGVSPGAIHLGSITIPVGQTQFAVAAGRREEFEGRVRTWNEIQVQSSRVEANESFKDRVKAIEERKAKERAERNGSGGTANGGSNQSGNSGNNTGNGGKPPGGN